MLISELAAIVNGLDRRQPLSDSFECPPDGSSSRWDSQKDHLLGWMSGYDGPGAYRRKQPGQDARFLYNHLRCAPALLFLAEALGEEKGTLHAAMNAVLAAPKNPSSQCAAFRLIVPWSRIEDLILQYRPARTSRLVAPWRRLRRSGSG
jgi:hypothetical protein